MRRFKVYAPAVTAPTMTATVAAPVVYRAAAAPAKPAAPKPAPAPKPMPTAAQAQTEVNREDDFVAAGLVPAGKPVTAGRVALVPPGGSYTAPAGTDLRCFIHRDGSGVKFAGAAGEIALDPPEVLAEFGPLVPDARRLLAANAPAGPVAAPKLAPKPVAKPAPKPAAPVRRAADADVAPAADAAAAVARAAKSAGSPLPATARAKLEGSYNADLGAVRVHTDSAADAAARSVHAHAFATGPDVYFRSGQYRPDTPAGEKLLAHEVAHTVQQAGGGGEVAKHADPAEVPVTSPGDRVEREAEAAADAAVRGRPAALAPSGGVVARLAEAPAPKAPASPAAKKDSAPLPGKPAAKTDAAPPPADAKPKGKDKPPGDEKGKPPAEAKGKEKKPARPGGEPAEGGGLEAVVAGVKDAAGDQKEHTPAEQAATQAEQAADVTPDQAAGLGKGDQVKAMAGKQPNKFDREQFKKALRDKIAALQADDAKNIKDGDKAGQINAAVKGEVAAGKQAAGGEVTQAAKQEPPAGEPKKGADLPKAEPGAAPKVDGGKAVPPPVPDEKVSMAGESAAIDEKMAAAKVTPEQLGKANEPAFQAAADARATAQAQAEALPTQARDAEAKTLGAAKAEAAAATEGGLAAMHGKRAEALTGGQDKQADGKAKHEAARKKVTDELTLIYTDTKAAVDKRLEQLDKDVATTFDEGADEAKSNFNWFIGAKLLVHYATGGWIVDAFTGGDSKEEIFKEGRDKYLADMEVVIDRVATVVETGLTEVVGLIEAGRVKLEAALARLGPDEQAVGQEVAAGLRDQFAQMEQSVEAKQAEIVDSVAQKYTAALKEVDSTIAALRDPVGAVIGMAVDAVAGVIETILKMKELLMSALAKAGEAIDLILADPIGFLGNLVAGVKQGVQNFVGNIGTHLKKGLMDWLFGALAQAGIQMPDKFDLSGLLSIVLQVLGLNWANIRKRAVAILGENVVKALETASEIIVALVTKGPAGLWEYIKEQAAALLETLKEGVKSFVIESVIVAGVKWLIGLLNPASAFVKACLAIYDIVTFIINRGQQILEFVNAVLDSILSIAKGNIGPAAAAVEGALARAVPVAIGFLASLIGIGDLGEKLKKVIDKIQAPINKVIDWLIKKAASLVKAVGKALGIGGKEKKPDADPTMEDGVVAQPFSMAGEGHTLTAKVKGGQLQILVASDEMVLQSALSRAIKQLDEDEQFPRRKAILARLHQAHVLADYNTIIKDWNDQRQSGRFPDFLKSKVLKIVASLTDLGGMDIHSLDELFGRMKRGNGPYSHLADPTDVGPGKPFTSAQRTLILAENRKIHGVTAPKAVSDFSGAVLDDSVPANQPDKPNIDHDFPKSAGGTNSYSNAKVLARDENALKSATITNPLPFAVPQNNQPAKPTVIRRPKPQTP